MKLSNSIFEIRFVSSLVKVFADEELTAQSFARGTAFRNEVYSFQTAYRADYLVKGIRVSAVSALSERITVRSVGLVPSDLPTKDAFDEDMLRTVPGLYPDPLFPVDEREGICAPPRQWRSVWVTVDPKGDRIAPGSYPIRIRFESDEEGLLGEAEFALDILPAVLPEQRLVHNEWLHVDCLATHYRVPVFSEQHWAIVDNYMKTAVEYGINTILTPIFTPPLDTVVGGERPTVQLVDVERTADGNHRFGFGKLERWVELCNRNGFIYFAFSHLFTQWGARHAPKIIAAVNGQEERIFGWETDAAGAEYRAFLDQFLPELKRFIEARGLESRSLFHISDEPEPEHFEAYRSAKAIVNTHLAGYPIMDALSDYTYYEQGLVERPITASDHIESFIAGGVPQLWTYYCNAQYRDVANRFFSMPSSRNRIIGLQLFKFGLAGFAHWGYNFWYTQYSIKEIDPFRVTDAGCAFPSGDAFLVYPGDDGKPISSIRFEVLREAFQDLRAMELLATMIGQEAAVAFLEEGLEEPLTFAVYPRGDAWLLAFRERLNSRIQAALN